MISMKSNQGRHVFFRRTVVVGAGYIAVEMAAILHHLGSDVTMLVRKEKVLRTFDQDISDRITKEMEETGIKIMKTTQVTRVEKNSSGLTIKTDTGASIDAECLLWAVGRTPNVESLSAIRSRINEIVTVAAQGGGGISPGWGGAFPIFHLCREGR